MIRGPAEGLENTQPFRTQRDTAGSQLSTENGNIVESTRNNSIEHKDKHNN